MSTSPASNEADASARARGWAWLAALPRPAVAHDQRGPDPLGPVRHLLAALDHPEAGLNAIHIVGSKGKGSTALIAEALLLALDQSTLTFTSPHLERWTERLRIDGAEVDGATGLAAIEAVRHASETAGIRPGFFEALTVAALWLARERAIDWCVLEAGVGGRADATNVIAPALVVLTSIELEHVDRLGDSLGAIAREKAGAIKRGAPIVLPALPLQADAVVNEVIDDRGVYATRVRALSDPGNDSGNVETVRWRRKERRLELDLPGGRLDLPLEQPGDAMASNAALAAAAVWRLGLASREDLQRAARRLQGHHLPGRFETLSTLPWVIIDSAHTRASAESLAAALRPLPAERVTLLLSLSSSKDWASVTDPLLELADTVVTTQADPDYSLAADALAERLIARWPELDITAVPDVTQALRRACDPTHESHLTVATGSVYLAGRVRGLLAI